MNNKRDSTIDRILSENSHDALLFCSVIAGMVTITDQHMERFNTLLLDYYNTGEGEQLKRFLYDSCIQGISKI